MMIHWRKLIPLKYWPVLSAGLSIFLLPGNKRPIRVRRLCWKPLFWMSVASAFAASGQPARSVGTRCITFAPRVARRLSYPFVRQFPRLRDWPFSHRLPLKLPRRPECLSPVCEMGVSIRQSQFLLLWSRHSAVRYPHPQIRLLLTPCQLSRKRQPPLQKPVPTPPGCKKFWVRNRASNRRLPFLMSTAGRSIRGGIPAGLGRRVSWPFSRRQARCSGHRCRRCPSRPQCLYPWLNLCSSHPRCPRWLAAR